MKLLSAPLCLPCLQIEHIHPISPSTCPWAKPLFNHMISKIKIAIVPPKPTKAHLHCPITFPCKSTFHSSAKSFCATTSSSRREKFSSVLGNFQASRISGSAEERVLAFQFPVSMWWITVEYEASRCASWCIRWWGAMNSSKRHNSVSGARTWQYINYMNINKSIGWGGRE
jgi:hypothetical protein